MFHRKTPSVFSIASSSLSVGSIHSCSASALWMRFCICQRQEVQSFASNVEGRVCGSAMGGRMLRQARQCFSCVSFVCADVYTQTTSHSLPICRYVSRRAIRNSEFETRQWTSLSAQAPQRATEDLGQVVDVVAALEFGEDGEGVVGG